MRRYLDAARTPDGLRAYLESTLSRRAAPSERSAGLGPGLRDGRGRRPELMAVTLARLLRDGEVACHGVNSVLPSLAMAWPDGSTPPGSATSPSAAALDGAPATLPRSSSGSEWLDGSPVVLSNVDVYQLALRGRIDVMLLGCVQVDGRGRVNSTVIGDFARPRVRLPGRRRRGRPVPGGPARDRLPDAPRPRLAGRRGRLRHRDGQPRPRGDAARRVPRDCRAGSGSKPSSRAPRSRRWPAERAFAVEPLPGLPTLAPPTPAELAALDGARPGPRCATSTSGDASTRNSRRLPSPSGAALLDPL